MIKAAGIGVAVGNAVPELKAVADIVTNTNNDNAIARIIYDLVDGKIKI
jgi:hydroxymethylpyrimidine pyrophosphatase-like HAD family hydrolase